MTDRLSQLLSGLAAGGDRTQLLLEVRPALSALSRKEVEDGLKEIDLCPMFDCLNSPDSGGDCLGPSQQTSQLL